MSTAGNISKENIIMRTSKLDTVGRVLIVWFNYCVLPFASVIASDCVSNNCEHNRNSQFSINRFSQLKPVLRYIFVLPFWSLGFDVLVVATLNCRPLRLGLWHTVNLEIFMVKIFVREIFMLNNFHRIESPARMCVYLLFTMRIVSEITFCSFTQLQSILATKISWFTVLVGTTLKYGPLLTFV